MAVTDNCMSLTRDGVLHIVRATSGSLQRAHILMLCGWHTWVGTHELGVYPPYFSDGTKLCPTCQAIIASATIRGCSLLVAAVEFTGIGSVVPEEDK